MINPNEGLCVPLVQVWHYVNNNFAFIKQFKCDFFLKIYTKLMKINETKYDQLSLWHNFSIRHALYVIPRYSWFDHIM